MKITKVSLDKATSGQVYRCSIPSFVADKLENDPDYDWFWDDDGLDKFLNMFPQYRPENQIKPQAQREIQAELKNHEARLKLNRENAITDIAREDYDKWKKS